MHRETLLPEYVDLATQDWVHTVLAVVWHTLVCKYPEGHTMQEVHGPHPVPEKLDPATQGAVHTVLPVVWHVLVCKDPGEHTVQEVHGITPVLE